MNYITKNKLQIVVLCTIILILSLASCMQSRKAYVERQVNGDNITLRYDETSMVNGGKDIKGNVLANVSIGFPQNDLEQIELDFSYDSEWSFLFGNKIPEYNISTIDGVDRLLIRIKGLENSFFADESGSAYLSEVINGTLLQKAHDNSDYTYIYVSTRCDFTYDVIEDNDKLIITFEPKETEETLAYYIKADTYEDYENGEFDVLRFFPSLSDDLQHGVMLCGPFVSYEQAKEYIDYSINGIYQNVDTSEMSIELIASTQLPKYEYSYKIEDLLEEPIGKSYGEDIFINNLLQKGRFLTKNNAEDCTIYAKYCIDENIQDNEKRIYEELWLCSQNDSKRISEIEFSSIIYGEYSYDDRYLAIINQGVVNKELIVFDIESGKIVETTVYEFDNNISNIVWAEDEHKLYAISGEDENKQLFCYEINEIGISTYLVDNIVHMSSVLYIRDNIIYFLNKNEDDIGVYSLNLLNGSEKLVAEGNSFKIADDEPLMIINDISSDDSGENSLSLYDISEKEIIDIVKQKKVVAYSFNSDNSRIYYTVNNVENIENEYPVTLYYYDVEQKKTHYVMDMIAGALYPGCENDMMKMISTFSIDNIAFPVTINFEIND